MDDLMTILLIEKMFSGVSAITIDMVEMDKLRKLLDDANIIYAMGKNQLTGSPILTYYGKKGIPTNRIKQEDGYYSGSSFGCICSVIYGYGSEEGLLEISGLLTEEELTQNFGVIGHLTAENIFERIKNHWDADANV